MPSPSSGQPAASADSNECRRLIEATHLIDPATIDAVDPCRFNAAGEQAARAVLSTNVATVDQQWAAIWVYAASGSDPAPLRPLVASTDSSISVMAAAALVAFGDPSGFAVVAQELNDGAQLIGSHPPTTIANFALSTVSRYVVGDNVPSPPEATDDLAARTIWADWLSAHGAALVFNQDDGTWSAP